MSSVENASLAASEAAAPEHAGRIVWRLAWPAVALNSLQVVNTLLDRGFIGHLDPAALTAHGGSTTVLFLMFSLAMAFGTASTALVSRAFGAGHIDELRTAARQSVVLTAIAGVLFGVLGFALAGQSALLLLPKNDPEAIRLMTQFLMAYAVGLPAIYIIQSLAGSLRGIGDTKSPMMISGLQILMHVVLNYTLIFPPKHLFNGLVWPGADLGLTGAGIALSTSAWITAIIYLAFSGRTPLGAVWRVAMPSFRWCARILRIALPAALMAVLRVASLGAFTIILAAMPDSAMTLGERAASGSLSIAPLLYPFTALQPLTDGSIAIAAMSTGFAIESIMIMPSFGLAMAAAALVGQSLGMRRPDRAEALGWTAGHHAAIVTTLLAVPIFLGADAIALALLGDKPLLVAETAFFIRWLCGTEFLFAYAMALIGAMQGAGDTVRPLWITIVCLWGLRVPLAFILAMPAGMGLIGSLTVPIGFGLGALGNWIAMSATQGLQGIFAIWLFKLGAWKKVRV